MTPDEEIAYYRAALERVLNPRVHPSEMDAPHLEALVLMNLRWLANNALNQTWLRYQTLEEWEDGKVLFGGS